MKEFNFSQSVQDSIKIIIDNFKKLTCLSLSFGKFFYINIGILNFNHLFFQKRQFLLKKNIEFQFGEQFLLKNLQGDEKLFVLKDIVEQVEIPQTLLDEIQAIVISKKKI